MTNHSVINASGKTHAKMRFSPRAVGPCSGVVSASKSDAMGTRTQVVKAGASMQIAVGDAVAR